jgi:hypothetical protein
LKRAIDDVLAGGDSERAAARAAAVRVRACFSASAVCSSLERIYQETIERP